MLKVTMTIDTSNAGFQDCPDLEFADLFDGLEELILDFAESGDETRDRALMDSNGNTCGRVRMVQWVVEAMRVCEGTCGQPTTNIAGMCYQCQCEAHAEGWYDMDEGYVRL